MTTAGARSAVIERWMRSVLADGGLDRYDDLHIDRIDEQWAHREQWLSGGLEALRLAQSLRDRIESSLVVVLTYSLRSGKAVRGVNFRTRDEFVAELDWSPPSLYLFRPDQWPVIPAEPDAAVRLAADALFAGVHSPRCDYLEFRATESTDCARSVLVLGTSTRGIENIEPQRPG